MGLRWPETSTPPLPSSPPPPWFYTFYFPEWLMDSFPFISWRSVCNTKNQDGSLSPRLVFGSSSLTWPGIEDVETTLPTVFVTLFRTGKLLFVNIGSLNYKLVHLWGNTFSLFLRDCVSLGFYPSEVNEEYFLIFQMFFLSHFIPYLNFYY